MAKPGVTGISRGPRAWPTSLGAPSAPTHSWFAHISNHPFHLVSWTRVGQKQKQVSLR